RNRAVHEHGRAGVEPGDDGIGDAAGRAAAQAHAVQALVAVADQGDVGNLGIGPGRILLVLVQVVGLNAVGVGIGGGVRRAHGELQRASPAGVPVEHVVVDAGAGQVLGRNRAAEPFEAIVQGLENLHVGDRGLAAYSAHGQTVDLVVGGEFEAGVLDAHVFQFAGTVGIVVAAIGHALYALDGGGAAGEVDAGLAEDDHAAEIAAFGVLGIMGGEDDGFFFGAHG